VFTEPGFRHPHAVFSSDTARLPDDLTTRMTGLQLERDEPTREGDWVLEGRVTARPRRQLDHVVVPHGVLTATPSFTIAHPDGVVRAGAAPALPGRAGVHDDPGARDPEEG
jgi:hypothetical protein